MFKRLHRLVLLIFWITSLEAITGANAVTAQTPPAAGLSPPQMDDFPLLQAYLDVHNEEGVFIHDLQLEQVIMLEDERRLPVSELEELHPGVQFVIAITPGSSFGIRDSLGVSRYDYLMQGVLAGSWRQNQTSQDDYSLITADGPELIHVSDPNDIAVAWQDYQPQTEQIAPTLEVLARAIEIAADETPRPGMERAVLFITPPQLSDVTVGLQSLAGRANQQGIRLFVWLVAAADYFGLPGANQLSLPTELTGGQFLPFSGAESVPDLETYLEPLRHIYRLAYTSQITTSGSHQVAAEVTASDLVILSAPQTFDIELLPPSPIFVSPPAVITRTFESEVELEEEENPNASLTPSQQSLSLRIEFPDGYSRPLAHTQLYADGVIVDENTAPPFDKFTWDLSGYTQNGEHVLQAEAIDGLGMSGKSVETSIKINVPTPTRSFLASISRQKGLIIVPLVILAGAILGTILLLGGYIQPRSFMQRTAPRRARRSRTPSAYQSTRKKFPLFRRIEKTETDHALRPSSSEARRYPWMNRFSRLATPKVAKTQALLAPLSDPDQVTLAAPCPLDGSEASLGLDAEQATIPLGDPSVAALHARLVPENGSYRITDAGSIAGTWVNYQAVPPEGILLCHNDLIHIGRVAIRYILRHPGRLPKPVVIPLEKQA